MKIVLIALNARYSHSNPALRYLKHACTSNTDWQCEWLEWSINGNLMELVEALIATTPQAVGFSCYIWNIQRFRELALLIRQVLPDTIQIWGGPEAGSNAALALANGADYVIRGEGEPSLPPLLNAIARQDDLQKVPGLVWLENGQIKETPLPPFVDLSALPFLYSDADLATLDNRIVYYESSRGCPFCCHFCLSAREAPRYRDLALVFADLTKLIASNIRQVKFIDRTFNSQSQRTLDILQFLLDHYRPGINFHLEIEPALLNEAMLQLFAHMPPGYIQVEAGVQSTNPVVLANVGRHFAKGRWAKSLQKLIAVENIHVHLDIIAGLPGEDIVSLRQTFHDLHTLYPHYLQLGFLKVLPGTPLAEQAETWGITFQADAPYRVESTPWLTENDWPELKLVESVLNKYYNTGCFSRTLWQATSLWPQGAYDFYRTMGQAGLGKIKKFPQRYTALYEFLLTNLPDERWLHTLRLDWYHAFGNTGLPSALVYGPPSAALLKVYQEKVLQYRPDFASLPRHKWHQNLLATVFPVAGQDRPFLLAFDQKVNIRQSFILYSLGNDLDMTGVNEYNRYGQNSGMFDTREGGNEYDGNETCR